MLGRSVEMTFWSAFGLVLIAPGLWLIGEISLGEALMVAGIAGALSIVFGLIAARLQDRGW